MKSIEEMTSKLVLRYPGSRLTRQLVDRGLERQTLLLPFVWPQPRGYKWFPKGSLRRRASQVPRTNILETVS